MSSDLLNIGVSGLKAYQSLLNTTGQNVSNATVEGYTRQRTNLSTSISVNTGSGYFGTGVKIEDTVRVADQYLDQQIRSDRSVQSNLQMQYDLASQVDELIAAETTGLSSRVQGFFDALASASADPSSIPARQLVLSEADALVGRLHTIDTRIEDINDNASSEIRIGISQVNEFARSIAQLNAEIVVALGKGYQPNDLLDQRNVALSKLSEYITTQTLEQPDGSINVFVGSGQSLVVGQTATSLRAIRSPSDANKVDVVQVNGTNTKIITDAITGGAIGGAVYIQNSLLDEVKSNIGIIAMAIASEINDAQARGLDLNGNQGSPLFTQINRYSDELRVQPNSMNQDPNATSMRLEITDLSNVVASKYQFEVPDPLASSFQVRRLSDGVVVAQGSLSQQRPLPLEFDGLRLVVDYGDFHQGDKFLLDATTSYIDTMEVVMPHPESLAFASPLEAVRLDSNLGSGTVSQLEMLGGLQHVEDSTPLLVEFTSANRYRILDNSDPLNPKSLVPPLENLLYVEGQDALIFSSDPEQKIYLSDGINAGALTLEPVSTSGSTPINRLVDELITIDFYNQFGQISDSKTLSINAGDPVSTVAARLNAIDGVTATAITEVPVYLVDSSTGLTPVISVNGVSLTNPVFATDGAQIDVPTPLTHDYLAMAANQNADLIQLGITARAEDGGITFVSTKGDDIVIEFFGDSDDRLIVGQRVDPSIRSDSLVNLPQDFGLDGSDRNFSFDIDVGFGPVAVSVSGTHKTEHELLVAVQSSLNSALQDDSLVTASIEDGRLVFTSSRLVDNPTISISNRTNDPFGFATAESMGVVASKTTVTMQGQDSLTDGLAITANGILQVTTDDRVSLQSNAIGRGSLFSTSTLAKNNYHGFNFSIAGTPTGGDRFVVRQNESLTGDNRNLLSMLDIQTKSVIGSVQGTRTINDYYGLVVEAVGSTTNRVSTNNAAAKSILNQSEALRQSISGVNLDEEAANLIMYEQAYGASSRVITIARSLFDLLLDVI